MWANRPRRRGIQWPQNIKGDARCLDAESLQHAPKSAPDVSLVPSASTLQDPPELRPEGRTPLDHVALTLPVPDDFLTRRHESHDVIVAWMSCYDNKKTLLNEIFCGKPVD